MNVRVDPHGERLIERQLRDGRYHSPEEVVARALETACRKRVNGLEGGDSASSRARHVGIRRHAPLYPRRRPSLSKSVARRTQILTEPFVLDASLTEHLIAAPCLPSSKPPTPSFRPCGHSGSPVFWRWQSGGNASLSTALRNSSICFADCQFKSNAGRRFGCGSRYYHWSANIA